MSSHASSVADPYQRILNILDNMTNRLTGISSSMAILANLSPVDNTTLKTPEPPRRAELLNLPVELRLMIYHYVVVSPKPLTAAKCSDERPIFTEYGGVVERMVSRRLPAEPALSMTSRQIRDEVLPLFYDKNVFIFKHVDRTLPFASWLDRLPRPRSSIHNILREPFATQHISTVILMRRKDDCRDCPAALSAHGHSLRVTIDRRPRKPLTVQLGDAAAAQCACVMFEAIRCRRASRIRFLGGRFGLDPDDRNDDMVTAMAKEIESLELYRLQPTTSFRAAALRTCESCGLSRPQGEEAAFGSHALSIFGHRL